MPLSVVPNVRRLNTGVKEPLNVEFHSPDRRSVYIINEEDRNLAIYEWVDGELQTVNIPFDEIRALSDQAIQYLTRTENANISAS